MERDNFNELGFALTTALIAFMTCDEVGSNDKVLIKVNRFKKFVNGFIDEVNNSRQANDNKQGVIDFSETETPEDNSNY